SGVKLTAPKPSGGSEPNQPSTGTPVSTSPAGSGSSTDATVAFVTVGALLILGLLLLAARRRNWRAPARALLTRARARLAGRTRGEPVPEPALGVQQLNL